MDKFERNFIIVGIVLFIVGTFLAFGVQHDIEKETLSGQVIGADTEKIIFQKNDNEVIKIGYDNEEQLALIDGEVTVHHRYKTS